MNWFRKYTASQHLTWRLIEWIILIGQLLDFFSSTNTYRFRLYLIPVFIAFTVIFWLLSFIFPVNRPMWQRRAYIAVELGLIVVTEALGLSFNILMYFILAKSCFFLKRKDAIITIVLTGVAFTSAHAWDLPYRLAERTDYINSHGIENYYSPVYEYVFEYLLEYIQVSFFVALLVFVLVAEAKSRRRAEVLSKEVEVLATALERTRIARDIHDSLGHTLTTLGVQLELAQKLHGVNSAKATQALKNSQNLAHQSLIEVRSTVSTMRQENFNLNRALITLVEQFYPAENRSFNLQTNIDLPVLPLQTSHQIYCIVKEALNNIQKHSQASTVNIKSQTRSKNTILEIADNGIGFDPQTVSSGFGLNGMYERTQIIKGQIKIDTAPGKGTRIQLNIPS